MGFIGGDSLYTTLSQVNDKEFTLSLDLALFLCWFDPRLEFPNKDSTPDFIIDPNLQEKLWVPDAEIGPLKYLTRTESIQGGKLQGKSFKNQSALT